MLINALIFCKVEVFNVLKAALSPIILLTVIELNVLIRLVVGSVNPVMELTVRELMDAVCEAINVFCKELIVPEDICKFVPVIF